MNVLLTGASGLIGKELVARLLARGDEVTILTRNPERARAAHATDGRSGEGAAGAASPTFVRWDPLAEPAPVPAALDAVVHLAGEPVSQRWSEKAKKAIRESRVTGTGNLVAGLRTLASEERPRALVSASAIGYYGPHGPEPIDEDAPAGSDFLAQVCAEWEAQARAAEELGMRTAQLRIGVVLERSGGALAQMLTPFRLGVGGPIAGGEQFLAWIHRDDLVGMFLAALDDERWSGAINGTAPEPVTNAAFSRALGHALHRPAFMPVPAFALRALYGEMSIIITTGVRAVPARALVLGYSFQHERVEEALEAALS